MDAQGRPWRAGIEHDNLRRYGAVVAAIVPFSDDLHDGIARLRMQDFIFLGDDGELAAQQHTGIDDRMLVHGQLRAVGNSDPEYADLGLAGRISRQAAAVPARCRFGQELGRYRRIV